MNETNISVANSTQGGPPLECEFSVDEDEGAIVEFVAYGIFLNLIGIFGLFGNIVSMIILSRPQMKSSINYLLIGLARCDTILIITSILNFGIPSIYPYTNDLLFNYKFQVYPKLVVLLFPVSMIAQMVTLYLTLTVTMERYVAVCHPLRARSMCTYGRARLAVLVIVIFSIVYNLPRFWEVKFVSETHWKYNVTTYCAKATDMRQDTLYKTIYIHWMYSIFYCTIPFGFLIVFNVAIYRQVRKANRDLQRLSRHQRREIGLASMLVCVVIVFILCNVLPLVTNIWETFYHQIPHWMVVGGNLTVTINSSVNFIIYVIFGRKFKRIFLRLFCSNQLFGVGRDSPEFQTNDDSVITNTTNLELRNSVRRSYHVHGSASTNAGRNNNNVVHHFANGNSLSRQSRKTKMTRSPSPGPCVYYPARSPPPPPPPSASVPTPLPPSSSTPVPARSPSQISRTSSTQNGWDKSHGSANNDTSL